MQLSKRLLGLSALILTLAACSGVETRPADVTAFAAGNYHYYRWRSSHSWVSRVFSLRLVSPHPETYKYLSSRSHALLDGH
jgi:hypothetical protein